MGIIGFSFRSAILLVATVLWTVPMHAEDDSADQIDDVGGVRTVRVLTIGNSFAQNACRYLPQISRDGAVDLIIGTANLGGCTLEKHATLAKRSAADPTRKPYTHADGNKRTQVSLQEYLKLEPWDFVTVQQMSALSFHPETFQPHLDYLVELIRSEAPQAKLVVHQTWAYRPDSPLLKQQRVSQDEMYQRLSKAYADVAQKYQATIIPVGTAFQRVREAAGHQVVVPDSEFDYDQPEFPSLPDQSNSLVVGWHWQKGGDKPALKLDFKHANAAGCYLAGLVWYETLTGKDAREITFVPAAVDHQQATFLRQTAHAVVADRR
ncbi:DUF4886 domain-containing protein [Stieleria sp. TO1_6]|uniref:DUF4886 domain-containing protein n=1 Tax=Stieleria tagensis TaxID=2956795 RepID=UPI00209B19DE|nr:DUF4886 domain-containing protein [Stieleria tagensis]MCO8125269.1 DUF4886 domain-containing protein [Stieleria tagensis]